LPKSYFLGTCHFYLSLITRGYQSEGVNTKRQR